MGNNITEKSEVKPEIKMLRQVESDLAFLKRKISFMEEELNEIVNSLYEVRPSYLKKLQAIEKRKFKDFKDVQELRERIS